MRRSVTRVALGTTLTLLLATPIVSLRAQRITPSGALRLEIAPPIDSSPPRPRSHADGAVHGAVVGLGAGALTGIAVYVVAHTFVASQDTQVVTSNDKVTFFWWLLGAGAIAGGAVGATIGGIVGR